MFVTEVDHRAALTLVGEASAARDRAEFLDIVLPGVRCLFDAEEVSYSEVALRPLRVWFMAAHPTTPSMRPAQAEVWTSRPADHPWMRRGVLRGYDRALRLSDMYTSTRLRSDPYYAEFYRPRGIAFADYIVLGRVPLLGGLGIGRARRDFSDAEHDLLEHLRLPLGAAWQRVCNLELCGGFDTLTAQSVHLTDGEHRVVDLVLQGLSNAAIANSLRVSHKAVEQHLTHVYRKLEVRSRAQLLLALLTDPVGT